MKKSYVMTTTSCDLLCAPCGGNVGETLGTEPLFCVEPSDLNCARVNITVMASVPRMMPKKCHSNGHV
jgi:hypothetical protein